jgi:hypothetical protein
MDWSDFTQVRDRWRALVKTRSIKCGEILEELSN